MPVMDGMLYKWTNYISGWQPRWFVLDKGILAYYKSQDEMHLGSKGSLKMACCEITVHPSDQCRLDLIIPGEQHFYIRGATPAERQQWLVALGSAKACLTNSKALAKEESRGTLKTKMSEVRLYCDLLMQQVHSVKSSTSQHGEPDLEKINEATSLLSATCDTFLRTLQDCMKIADDTFMQQMNHSTTSDSVLPPSLASPTENKTNPDGTSSQSLYTKRNAFMHRTMSVDRYQPPLPNKSGVKTTFRNLEDMASKPRYARSRSHSGSSSSPQSLSAPATPTSSFSAEGNCNSHSSQKPPFPDLVKGYSSSEEDRPGTIFSNMKYSFTEMDLSENSSIPTAQFLEAFRNILPIFDALGSTTFAPVKMDILGNIRKLNQKYMTDTEGYASLQLIVGEEIQKNRTKVKNSATDALLWLKRALEYVYEFLHEIAEGEKDLSAVASHAYSKSLKTFHGWVARGVFALVAKTVPYYEDFISLLAQSRADYDHPNFEKYIMKDMRTYLKSVNTIITILNDFYTENDLDFPEQI